MTSDRTLLQRLVARGFVPGAEEPVEPGPPTPELIVLCPTAITRCTAAEHETHVRHLLEQIAESPVTMSLRVGMQGPRGEVLARLRALPAEGFWVPGTGKRLTVNAAVRAATPRGWIWVDDDVRLEPGCLVRVAERFVERGCRGAVGATKVTHAGRERSSRALRAVGRATVPPRPYPTAACMAVEAAVVAVGIPPRRHDDAFVLFSLLNPDLDDPYRALEVLPDARCHHVADGGARRTLGVLRRRMLSHLTCAADAPWPVARLYLRNSLLYGLWPLAPWDGAARWAVKAVYALWLAAEVAVLAARGALGRPRREIPWGAPGEYVLP